MICRECQQTFYLSLATALDLCCAGVDVHVCATCRDPMQGVVDQPDVRQLTDDTWFVPDEVTR